MPNENMRINQGTLQMTCHALLGKISPNRKTLWVGSFTYRLAIHERGRSNTSNENTLFEVSLEIRGPRQRGLRPD